MREIRTYGSEGGGAARSPYPYPAPAPLQAKLRLQPVVQAKKIGESTLSPIL